MTERGFLPLLALPLFFFSAAADAEASGFLKRRLFAKGYVEWTLQPPRNEIDANLRRPDLQVETGGYGFGFARYSLRGQFFLGLRLGKRHVKNVFVVVKPDILLGDTIPQRSYTWSATPIGYVRNYGAGFTLWGDVQVYIETHSWDFVGKHELAVPNSGPKGLHNSIVIRKEFRIGDVK
jgi:hypothetical protein